MLNEEELKDAALLVFANKQDQPGAKGAGDISEALRLGELRDRNWSIMACSAVDGSGVNEGMDWLVVCLPSYNRTAPVRDELLTCLCSKPSTRSPEGINEPHVQHPHNEHRDGTSREGENAVSPRDGDTG